MNNYQNNRKRYNRVFFFLRPLIRWVYDFRCVVCDDLSFAHDVHHVDKNHTNNEAYNLVPVCRECHNKIHKGWLIHMPFRTKKQHDLLERLNELSREFCSRIK